MKIHPTNILVLMTALMGFSWGAFAQEPDPGLDGRVQRVQGRALELCFSASPAPQIGSEVEILGTSYVTLNKAFVREVYRPEGRAKVMAFGQPSCVTANLIAGQALRGWHARALGAH